VDEVVDRVADRVADYVLLRELGRGPHSSVYLARTPLRLGLGTDQVAVKVFTATGTDGFDAVAEELTVFAALGCPQLLAMYDVGIDDARVFCAMRHEPLGSLAAPARQLSRREQLLAVARAARGAHALHEAGLAHRGIGPTNVVLGSAGAVLAEPAVGRLLTAGSTLSPAGSGAGRLELVAPELMAGRPAGRATDIWSLGVTLHLVLTGHGLFPALASADPFTAVRMYLRSRPEPGDDLADDERAVVATAVQPDPERRYRTAADLAQAIEELAR
jgi:serine/threonine-protein kinase